MHSINPTTTKSWKALLKHSETNNGLHLRELLYATNRFKSMHMRIDDLLLFDYSKHRIDETTLSLLEDLFDECKVQKSLEEQFKGVKINVTENRPVLHTVLRDPNTTPFVIDDQDVRNISKMELKRMYGFAEGIRNGEIRGHSGEKFKHIVNIGIGGSDLGPKMAVASLKPFSNRDLKFHFVSNIDGSDLHECLMQIDPSESLFIVASKTFTTQETMTNAEVAKNWLIQKLEDPASVEKHFVAISTNREKVNEFGIKKENTFGFWDWVGGRYSLWGTIGMPICISIGSDNFQEFLNGANFIDNHTRVKPFRKNIPKIMAALGIWYRNFLKASTHAILPYDQYLHRFPAYLQQADMESNGKSIDKNGERVGYSTGGIIWGEPGTNGQHAFYQLIHQGTELIPSDFIASVIPQHPLHEHHSKLLSNFLAQTESLAIGKTIAPNSYEKFEGNQPTSTILFDKMDPFSLGALIAIYEHKIFFQGAVWNIYSYDQWGVELGKEMARKILPEIEGDEINPDHDESTKGLLNHIRDLSNKADNS